MKNEPKKHSKRNILVVDDDILVIDKIKKMCEPMNIHAVGFRSAVEALYYLGHSSNAYPVIILDYVLPDMPGDQLTRKVKTLRPDSFIFTLSGAPSTVENAVRSIKNGADNFFQKSDDSEILEAVILSAFKEYEESRATYLDDNISQEATIHKIVTASKKMKLLIAKAIQSASNRYNVLITGETGTGKEKVAKLISKRYGGLFFPVNCSQFCSNDGLLESELFGHEKGAFTDAKHSKEGIFEVASGGVVYLDEIDRMSLSAQAKLLRAIQEKKIKRLGGLKEIPVNIKLIASSKPNIKELRDNGEFLADLYGRINVIRLDIPPLRERVEDIEILLDFFAKEHVKEVGGIKTFKGPAIELMKFYHWPENVRELENFYIRLAIHTQSDVIRQTDLTEHLEGFKELTLQSIDSLNSLMNGEVHDSYSAIKEKLERMILSSSLQKFGSISETARQLKMSKSSLHAKLKSLDLLPRKPLKEKIDYETEEKYKY